MNAFRRSFESVILNGPETLALSAVAGRLVSDFKQLPVDESFYHFLQPAAKEPDHFYTQSDQGCFQVMRDSSAKEHIRRKI